MDCLGKRLINGVNPLVRLFQKQFSAVKIQINHTGSVILQDELYFNGGVPDRVILDAFPAGILGLAHLIQQLANRIPIAAGSGGVAVSDDHLADFTGAGQDNIVLGSAGTGKG